ncbi:MAG TPA: hypothetical protein VK635_19905 [Bradyrhizobium sp.]|jgi:hypothetical protein|nr:hypothetical protein [Bradyrhizobium sp.]
MAAAVKDVFNQKHFLAKVGGGKQVLEFHKNQHVFEQGDVAGVGALLVRREPTTHV